MSKDSLAAAARHAGEYVALRAVAGLVHAFSVDQNLRTAAALGSVYHRLSPRRAGRARQNVAAAFPEWPEARIRQVAEASVQNMFQLFLVESVAMPQLLNPRSWPRYVRFGDVAPIMRLLLSGKPALFITGHCGNWELLGFVLALLGFPMTALARPIDNPWVDRWLLTMREARGLRVLTKWGAVNEVQRLIEQGQRVGFIADQNAGEDGLFVPFFGRLASSYKSIGLLAQRYRLPVVVGLARRDQGVFRYSLESVDIFGPDDWEPQPDPLFYITARFNRGIETAVRAAPEQYLWLHRRWKSRPRFEREGRPFPAALRTKLEQLPWMTPAELARIEAASSPGGHAPADFAGAAPAAGAAP